MTDDSSEQKHHWHPIPAMIGEAITIENYGTHHSGGYLVRRSDSGNIEIRRVIEMAASRDELESDGPVTEMHDYVVTSEECGLIEAPEDWGSETEEISESIWEGWR